MKKLLLFLFLLASHNGLSQNIWQYKGTLPGSPRVESITFTLGSFAYYGTGYSSNSSVLTDMWKYEPSNNQWVQLNNFPVPLYGATAFVINDTAYVTNGRKTSGGNYNSNVYRYDQQLDTFIVISTYPGTPSYTTMSFVVNNKAYIGIGFPLTNEIWEYTPNSNGWTAKTNFPGALRQNASSFGLNGKGYVGGGAYDPVMAYDDFWSYDPLTNTWSTLPSIPGGGRFATIEFEINNKFYVGCGNNYVAYLKDLWSFDPFTNTWSQEDDFGGVARYAALAFSVGDVAYAGTGKAIGFLNDYWEFTLSSGLENLSSSFNYFPNPAKDLINFKGVNAIQNVRIFNSFGQLVANSSGQNLTSIRISNLQNGIYFMNVKDSNNQESTFKFIISK